MFVSSWLTLFWFKDAWVCNYSPKVSHPSDASVSSYINQWSIYTRCLYKFYSLSCAVAVSAFPFSSELKSCWSVPHLSYFKFSSHRILPFSHVISRFQQERNCPTVFKPCSLLALHDGTNNFFKIGRCSSISQTCPFFHSHWWVCGQQFWLWTWR